MNLEGLKKSMKQQEGQRSVKNILCYLYCRARSHIYCIEGCGYRICMECNEKCGSEMADGRPWSGSSV